MAAALSRALKLPGKKGSELGEYDPLTQADSEDESEEDDLVLNYPRNGLGRDSCLGAGSSKVRQPRRLVGGTDEALEDEDEDEDEWTERHPSKSRLDRDNMKGMQYWSRRDSDRERLGEDRGGAGASGSGGVGIRSADAEEKRMRVKNAVRSAFFLVPLVCAMLLVLLCAFLIPCQKGELEKKLQWEKAVGDAPGVSPPPALALWDVDGDSVEDVLLGVTVRTNGSHSAQRNKEYKAVALSAVSGQVLWEKVMRESVMYIQCGPPYSNQASSVCLIICKSVLMAVNGTTGTRLWSVLLKSIESEAVLLPDLQGDSVPDLLVATLPADATSDLSLTLISGLTGAKLGHPVIFNLSAQGKLIGPLLHETQQGAFYILFGLGNVQAISLQDLYIRAAAPMPLSPALRKKDPVWEGLKKSNSSFFIPIYQFRGSEHLEVLLPFVTGSGNNRNSLDAVSNLNTTRSDWVMLYNASILSLLRQRDLRKEWTFNSHPIPIHSYPAPGHFNNDGIPDLFVQYSANGVMRARVVDGAEGHLLWAAEFVCPRLVLKTSAIFTSTGQSAFLFWASEPIKSQGNGSRTTVAPGASAPEPLIRKLFLLHPTYPTILLELTSTTDTAVTFAVGYQEHRKDATYITVSSRPTTDSEPGIGIVKSMSLKAAIAMGKIVRLAENNEKGSAVKPGAFEVNTFFRRLAFKPQ